jgi:hypothetical protein
VVLVFLALGAGDEVAPFSFSSFEGGTGPVFVHLSLSLSHSLTKKFIFECLHCTGKLLLCVSQQIGSSIILFWACCHHFFFFAPSYHHHHLENSVCNEASHAVNADASVGLSDTIFTVPLRATSKDQASPVYPECSCT